MLEYMERGSLDTLIWDNDGSLKWSTRLQLMEDVAEGTFVLSYYFELFYLYIISLSQTGMAYLHGVHRSIHRDLKSPNVLLGEEGDGILRAKVADFGLARILGDKNNKEQKSSSSNEGRETKTVSGFISKRLLRKRKSSERDDEKEDGGETLISSSMTCGAGTSLWMAPELVETIQMEKEGTYEASYVLFSIELCLRFKIHHNNNTNRTIPNSYSQAVDIYAFGIILNEVLTLSRPWSRTKYTWSHEIYQAVMKGERPVATPDERSQAPFGFIRLMEMAYHQDVKNRPPFSDIAQALNEMRIQHHHSKHGSVSSSSSQRFASRTASMTSLISRADSSEDALLFSGESSEFIQSNRRSQNNSAVLMSLGCCAPSPPPKKTHLFELKSTTTTKKKKSGLTNSLRVPLLDIEEGTEED